MAKATAEKRPELSAAARLRLAELFDAYETNHESMYAMVIRRSQLDSLAVAATRIIQRQLGAELTVDRYDVKGWCRTAATDQLMLFVMGVHVYVSELERGGRVAFGASGAFAEEVNGIASDDGFPLYFDREKNGWSPQVSSDAEALRRVLLGNPADVAECKRGDPQVETVVSTVQALLARPNPVIVDYGAGLGRILSGFETAKRFANALYIAVDEPVERDVIKLAKSLGAKFEAQGRSKFLDKPTKADAIILLNTLHHIPFNDLPRQLSILLASLKEHGVLLVHEINELREPEQFNIPWEAEDITQLFELAGCVTNLRTMQTRSQRVPLTNMLVHVEGTAPNATLIAARCADIWARMKTRTLARIQDLYKKGDETLQLQLQYALITNANLDLNKP